MTLIHALYAQSARLLLPMARLYVRYGPSFGIREMVWKRFFWRKHDFRAKTFFGARINGNTIDLIQRYVYYFGVWEPNLSCWMRERLAAAGGRVFVDIGANIGYYTLLAARTLPAGGQVVAIEASPQAYQKLLANVSLNGVSNVRTVAQAVTNMPGQVTLHLEGEFNTGGATLLRGVCEGARSVDVEGSPLSAILTGTELERVRLVKIDVEGAEGLVVQGLQSVLGSMPHDVEFVVEVAPKRLAQLGHTTDTVVGPFLRAGFRVYILDNPYDASSYLRRSKPLRPKRLHEPLTDQADLVFSRIDADAL